MRRSLTSLVLAALLAAGACSSDSDDTSAITSLPDQTSTSTSTTEPETVPPDIIPSDVSRIDEAYVEGVMDALAQTALDALSATRREGVVTEEALKILRATNTDPNAARAGNGLAQAARENFEGYRERLGPLRYDVTEILVSSPSCIVAEIQLDSAGYFDTPPTEPPPGRLVVELFPAAADQRATGLNPTAWVINAIPIIDENSPIPKCESEL